MTSRLLRSLNPAAVWTAVLLMGSVALAAMAHSQGSGPAAAVGRDGVGVLCQAMCPHRSAPPRVGPGVAAHREVGHDAGQRPIQTDATR